MQNLFRRWFGGARSATDDAIAELREWARAEGHRFATSRGGEGFVIESAAGPAGWRAEWGPSQRDYIVGPELRVRTEIDEAGDLQMLLLTRALVGELEHEVYEQSTEGNQTRIDDRTPEEMRWLVLYPRMPRSAMPASLRERFAVLASRPSAAPMWLDGPLAGLLEASTAWLDAAVPLVMVVQRGRFVLRLAQAEPSLAVLKAAVALAAAASASARRVGAEESAGRLGSERPSSWGAPSAMPDPRER
jgi:hypothetical protein